MPSIHHRAPNLPTALFNHPTAMASIIADGLHVDFEVVKMSYRLLQDRLFLITDAVTPCNIGPYHHQLQGDKFVTPGIALSGSNMTMTRSVRNCVEQCGIPLVDALKMATLNPARVMGQSLYKGKIEIGQQADLLILDNEFEVREIIFGGEK
jgi:N-acetylglucosamine-6-phosphate deacetylase